MKTIQWKVAVDDNNCLYSMEYAKGFNLNSIESNRIIVNVLETLKQHHNNKINNTINNSITNTITITKPVAPANPFEDEDEEEDDTEI